MTLIFLNGLVHIGDMMAIKIGMKLNKDDAAGRLELGGTVIGVLDTDFTIYWIKLNKNTLPRFLNAVEEDYGKYSFLLYSLDDIESGDEVDFPAGNYFLYNSEYFKRLPNIAVVEKWHQDYLKRKENEDED